jgi:hypothetical protein
MKTIKKVIVILLIFLFTASYGWFVWTYFSFKIFLQYEIASIPKFDALNDAVLKNIPAPEEVKMTGRSRMGIDNQPLTHGRYLYVDYEIINTKSDDVIRYYHDFLLANGWVNQHSSPSGDYRYYSKNTSCIDLINYGNEYSLYIWHDFWKQDFSPPVVPNLNIDNILSLGYSTYLNCPR